MRILHFSDLHNNKAAVGAAVLLCREQPPESVVALTGDICSETDPTPDPSLNTIPQKLRLFVPGNHDVSLRNEDLQKWVDRPPWKQVNGPILFIGVGGSFGQIPSVEGELDAVEAVVILTHYPPDWLYALLEPLVECCSDKQVLILHGHRHNVDGFAASWKDDYRIGPKTVSVSNVYSAAKHAHGTANLIEWNGNVFTRRVVRPTSAIGVGGFTPTGGEVAAMLPVEALRELRVVEGEFRRHSTIAVQWRGGPFGGIYGNHREGFEFGVRKARLILSCLCQVQEFVQSGGLRPTDEGKIPVDNEHYQVNCTVQTLPGYWSEQEQWIAEPQLFLSSVEAELYLDRYRAQAVIELADDITSLADRLGA
jgi:hypothetical protein